MVLADVNLSFCCFNRHLVALQLHLLDAKLFDKMSDQVVMGGIQKTLCWDAVDGSAQFVQSGIELTLKVGICKEMAVSIAGSAHQSLTEIRSEITVLFADSSTSYLQLCDQ